MLGLHHSDSALRKPAAADEFEPWYDQLESHAGSAERSDLRRYLNAVYDRLWLVLGVIVLALSLAAAYCVVATPIYEARVKLLIESESPNVVSFKEVIEQNTAKLDYYETQLGILRSRTLARKTLDTLQLWNHPEFAEESMLRNVASRLMAALQPAGRPGPSAGETTAQSRAIDGFLDRLTISYRAENRLFDAGFRSADPRLAADVANTLARAYIDHNLELKLRASKEASDWLNARLAGLQKQVEASEMALQRYREQNADVSLSEQQNITVQKLGELSAAVTRAKMERIDAESLFQQLQAIRSDPSTADTLPIILSNAFVQQFKSDLANLQREHTRLSDRFGDRHPDVVRVRAAISRVEEQLRDEISKITEAVRHQIAAIQAKERSLSDALAAQERLALALNRRAIQYGVLQREVTSNRQVFEAMLERAKQTEISSELKITNIQIIDPAEVPHLPAAPQKRLVLLLALLIGLPLAVGAAVCLELFDDRVRSPEDIKAALGLRFLGFAPAIPRKLASAHASLVNGRVTPEFAEALRTVRANLIMCAPTQPVRSLLVTSTGPHEGKTIVATNLAVALSQAGRRVLLVDADMRQSHIHDIFDAPLEPGLSAVLQGTTPIGAALRPSTIAGLSIVTAGLAPPSPGDLLELPTFGNAIGVIGDQFDWVVIDSPPVLVASDAISLAHAATAVVFVVGAQMTSHRSARAALEQLEGAHANVIGAVLSRARVHRYASYHEPRHRMHRARTKIGRHE